MAASTASIPRSPRLLILFDGYSLLPCYRWHRHVVVPRNLLSLA